MSIVQVKNHWKCTTVILYNTAHRKCDTQDPFPPLGVPTSLQGRLHKQDC